MKKMYMFLVLFALIINLYGCTSNTNTPDAGDTVKKKITLYYADENNEKMVGEEREISYSKTGDPYKAAIEELIKGPKGSGLRANIPSGTTVYGTIKQNKDIIIDISSQFSGFGGFLAEMFAVGSIVNTLLQFEGIERVKILVEGEETIAPNGEPRGFMKVFPLTPEG